MAMSRPLAYVLADIHLRETRSRAHERWQETFFLDVLNRFRASKARNILSRY
jgi:hypothetical protein